MGAIVSVEQVEEFMSSRVVTETFDDNKAQTIGGPALALCIANAEGIFLGTIRGLYELPLVAPIDPLAVAVVLQLVHCQAIKRLPWLFREQLNVCQDAESMLKKVRDGDLQLDHPLRTGGLTPEAWSEEPRGFNRLEPTTDDE